ncbi:four helix bundle protein [Pedobacter sp. SYP-B3415]|uniref:four helix bundle protein n=1 Tax=Pedobacter sp. SYP-B3415 TaxID=2496641 RepID=UPI00101D22CD|nr:four helix bundle protein [Pedobacter sp. SYP-B3415]
MNNLKDLKIWSKAIYLTVDIYKLTADYPLAERFGLSGQSRRAAVSISSNIAEGASRNSNREFVNFLGTANGSSYELQTQLAIACRLGFLSAETVKPVLENIDELQKMTFGLQRTLNKRVKK